MQVKTITTPKHPALTAKRGPSNAGLARALLNWVQQGFERARQRHALARLSDTQLKDIGLSRRDVTEETSKPFWRE